MKDGRPHTHVITITLRKTAMKTKSTHSIQHAGIVLLSAAMLGLTSCSSTTEAPPPAETTTSADFEEGVPGGVIVNTLDISAKVTAIDHTTRKVTLLGPDGKKYKVKVGPQAVNFDQVQVGDTVKAALTEEMVVFMGDETSSQGDGSAAIVVGAAKGEPPAGFVAGTTQATGTVTAIDRQNRTATLQFEDGTTQTFPVRDDIDLSQHSVGEKVVFQVTEMIALSLEKP